MSQITFLLKNATQINWIENPQSLPSPWGMWTPSNTPIPQPTPLTIPNGIRIQSAVLPQQTSLTDIQKDRLTHGIGNSQ